MAISDMWRTEKDSFGEIPVPANRLWGAQTERSRKNFAVGGQRMPMEIIRAIAMIKSACAVVNTKLGLLTPDKCSAIMNAAGEIINGDLKKEFPLVVWQTGSGTQTNMNVNEVIVHLAGDKCVLHPNDDVNKSQSTNDVFPSAIHVAAVLETDRRLRPALRRMIEHARVLEKSNSGIVKVGRTHLQDATPMRFSDEISAWKTALEKADSMIEDAVKYVSELAIGGTAVGSGINAPTGFGKAVVRELNEMTQMHFVDADNKFYALSVRDGVCLFHSALKTLATTLMKIANDIRWLASGPRAGIGEIEIPQNEPGSSIMPGKVNPTQCEMLTMVAVEIMANDVAVSTAASQGNFQLNVFMPLLAFKVTESIGLLADGIDSLDKNCFSGIVADAEQMRTHVENSLMLATALSPYIGYDKAAQLVKYAYDKKTTLSRANIKLGLVPQELFIELIGNALKG